MEIAEMITLEHDVTLVAVKAETFPAGIQAAFDALRQRLPEGDTRMPYGISKPEKDGTIVYHAAVEAADDGEAQARGLCTIILNEGTYAAETIRDWQQKIHTLTDTFEGLLQHPHLDPATPCIEVYRNRTELVCMVRLKEKENLRH